MARSFEDIFNEFPKERQERIDAEADRLCLEYEQQRHLQYLQEALQLNAAHFDELLGTCKAFIEKTENPSSPILWAFVSWLASNGGKLNLLAELPDRDPVAIDFDFFAHESTNPMLNKFATKEQIQEEASA